MLHQGDLLKMFKENNLVEVNFLKLLTKENPPRMFSLAYNLPKTTSNTSTFCQKKVPVNRVDFSTIKIKLKKVSRNAVDISTREITSKKVRGCKADFSTIEITSKKVRGNNLDFATTKITSKKVRGNNMDFSISKITSKKFVEMTWKFVETRSSTYRRNIHVILTWIRRGVPFRKFFFC